MLQNITVLSAGQSIQTDGRSQPIVAPVVTLLVSPDQAEALTLANTEGHIQLVLRNSTDRATADTHGRRLHDLYGAPPAETIPPAAKPHRTPSISPSRSTPAITAPASVAPASELVPAAEPDRMIVIRGATKKVEVFSQEREAK